MLEPFSITIFVLLCCVTSYAFWQNHKHIKQLMAEHDKAMAAVAAVAECAIETVKASSLAEREQVRVQKRVNDVQLGQMRDIIRKQAEIVSDTPPALKKVRLEDGTEVQADEYDWGFGL